MLRVTVSTSQEFGFMRYVMTLFNRCPHWLAGIAPDGEGVIAQSPTGMKYLLQVHRPGTINSVAIRGLLLAATQHGVHKSILIAKDEAHTLSGLQTLALQASRAELRDLARLNGILFWTLDEVDGLVMAGSMESNAPLAQMGLEVQLPDVLSAHTPIDTRLTQGF